METKTKSVLCVFGERKRPIIYDSADDWEQEKDNLMRSIKATFSDLLGETETLESYFLQQESAEWGGLIDVHKKLKDHDTVHLCFSSANSEVSLFFFQHLHIASVKNGILDYSTVPLVWQF